MFGARDEMGLNLNLQPISAIMGWKKKVSNPKFLMQERAARWGVQSEGAGGFTLTETMEQIIWIDKT